MSLLSTLANAVEQKPDNVETQYDQVAQNVPKDSLAQGITQAFQSNETPPFSQMIGSLFNNSNPEQRSGLLTKLLSGAQGSGLTALGAQGGGLGSLISAFTQTGQVTPEQAQNVSGEEVSKLAGHVEQHNPSIVAEAGHFFSQHPGLIKSLGVTAMGLVLSRIGRR